MRSKLNRRILSAILAFVVIFSCCPAVGLATENLVITHEGQPVSQISVDKHGKVTVAAECLPEGTHQWQIRVPNTSIWVDIQEETAAELDLTYALLGSLLEQDRAMVRCASVQDDQVVTYTDSLQVTVTEQIVQQQFSAEFPTTFASDPQADPDPAAEDGELNLISITIRYTYIDHAGNPIDGFHWPDYVANTQSGDPYRTTVQIKSIPGYEAELAENYPDVTLSDDKRTITFDLASVTEPMVYTIRYREVLVPYHVRRFLQNVTNDLYTEDFQYVDDVFEGYPGHQPDPVAIYREADFPGFTALYYQPDTIAADGSTVFEIYYDRNYYLINFELDDGYGVSPIYARYGTNISVPAPTKHGYVFKGWQLIREGDTVITNGPTYTDISGTVPNANQVYKALWENAETEYSIEYWILDDHDTADTADDTRRFLGSRKVGAYSGDVVSGQHDLQARNGWLCNGEDGKHAHSEAQCRLSTTNMQYMLPAGADTGKVVKGDGSTAVNVYYSYKAYDLIFYYARTQGGRDSDGDGCVDTDFTQVQIMGGSSYAFGSSGTSTSDDATLLKGVGSWGNITALPGLKRNADVYTKGVLSVDNGWDYHYISFRARYGDSIADLWPCDVIEPATRTDVSTQTWWTNTTAFVSAWNGEHHVKYSQDTSVNNGNQTIKGLYQRLNENLLFQTGRGWADESTVSYLCFWENGAAVDWSVPELYVYNIWLPCLGNDPANAPIDPQTNAPKETKYYENTWYYLDRSYNTCDNSTIKEQTVPGLTGYSYRNTEWGAIFISKASLSGSTYTGAGGGKYNASSQTVQSSDWYVSQQLTATLQSNNQYLLTSADYDAGKYGPDVNPSVYREAYFRDYYYTSVNPRLFYKNHGSNMGDGTGAEVPYGTNLQKYGLYFSKQDMENKYYPSNLEDNAYEFDGWYTSDSFQETARMDWTGTMPDSNVTVYAHWKPKTYNVRFYLNYEDYLQQKAAGDTLDESLLWYEKTSVSHGQLMTNLDYSKVTPTRENYTFVRWVYEDDAGNKYSFEPTQMPVRSDLKLYAEWRSSAVSTYTVRYIKGEEVNGQVVPMTDADGNYLDLSTPLTGYAVVSTTKTVRAKARYQLDLLTGEEANQAWFPHTSSHSILIKDDPAENVFAFIYVTKASATYTVHYRDAETNQPLADSEEFETQNAEETIWFKYVEGYVPDALYKHLVLSANDDDNVLIFYYSVKAPDEALYQVTHFLQLPDGSGYEEYRVDSYTGAIGSEVTHEPIAIPGATFHHSEPAAITTGGKTVVKGTVTSGADEANKSLELRLYYNRDRVQYTVQYKNQNDPADPKMPASETYTGLVGDTVFANWKDVAGYELISSQTQTLKLSRESSQNVITFWYQKKDVHIRYVAKCTEPAINDFGVLNRSEDSGTQVYGATAMSYNGCYFAGWYSDEACTMLVESNVHLDPELPPNVYEYTYYALFKPYTLTIHQTGMIHSGDSAVYEVLRGSTVVARVMLTGNSSVTILKVPAGAYTVREVPGDWTWTYQAPQTDRADGVVTVVAEQTNAITFTYGAPASGWLHGEDKN